MNNNNEDKEICTISLGNGVLDNDYTFFESGKIRRFYDNSIYKHSLTSWMEVGGIEEHTKKKLIEKCPDNFLQRIQELLLR